MVAGPVFHLPYTVDLSSTPSTITVIYSDDAAKFVCNRCRYGFEYLLRNE